MNAVQIILWIIGVALIVYGVLTLVRGGVLLGIVLIVVGLIVAPGLSFLGIG